MSILSHNGMASIKCNEVACNVHLLRQFCCFHKKYIN